MCGPKAAYAQISGDAEQRVDHPLDVLIRSGFVRKSAPLGAPKNARSTYTLHDPYLAFWFGVLYAERSLIEGGQGPAVVKRTAPRWQSHLGRTFEDLARRHAQRLVETGVWPEDMIVGRWRTQRGDDCEVDVLGLRGKRTALIGEARWQRTPLGTRDLGDLRAKLRLVPHPVGEPILALWGRSGGSAAIKNAGASFFNVRDVVDGA